MPILSLQMNVCFSTVIDVAIITVAAAVAAVLVLLVLFGIAYCFMHKTRRKRLDR